MPRVKAKRQYTSTLRKQQASQTRARILDTAQVLFTSRGYGATTMEAIASEAGVATDTVYASFGTKAGLLHNLLDVRVGGDDAPVALLDRAGPRKVRAEPSQRKQIASFAADVAEIQERAVPVDDIIRGAAAVDPEIAAFRARMHRFRYDNMRQFVSWLAAKGPLRAGISEEDAAAIVWTLAGPEVHGLLRRDRGWSQDRYVSWLSDTLARTLL
ncbi:MAG: TetR/AcrR family transcriptional regulator [Chloroflexi bacterium]|nr:MAG: TetR/AcrR family transcriptional regulator [Chloroflexota bacterium]